MVLESLNLRLNGQVDYKNPHKLVDNFKEINISVFTPLYNFI